MINDLDIDMEELESRLYSQVYHQDSEESQILKPPVETMENTVHNHRQRIIGYQQNSNPRYVWSRNKQSAFIPINTDQQQNKAQYMTPERENIIPQVVHVVNSSNNVLILPQASAQFISDGINANNNLANFMKRQHLREMKKTRKLEKTKRRRQQKKEQKKELQRQLQLESENQSFGSFSVHRMSGNVISSPQSVEKPNKSSVVHISDSDSDSCMEIIEKRELIVVSSDDEVDIKTELSECEPIIKYDQDFAASDCNFKTDDDVIFVEPVPKEIEVIDIDCESTTALNERHHGSETNSTNSDNPMKIPRMPLKQRPPATSKEPVDSLYTPDSSTSNDFLDNCIDLHQNKFNFGLHGADFGNSSTSTKSKVPNEISETESTCSASDINTPSRSKIFHEVDFETPNKRFFDENNLESFSDYITPNRDTLNAKTKEVSFAQVCTRTSATVPRKLPVHDSSDSSSESDYDDGEVSYLNNSKKLPELSSVTTHVEPVINTQIEVNKVNLEDNVTVMGNAENNFKTGNNNVGIEGSTTSRDDTHSITEDVRVPESSEGKRKLEEEDTPNKKLKLAECNDEATKLIVTIEANNDGLEERPMADNIKDIKSPEGFIIIDEVGDELSPVKDNSIANYDRMDTDDTESFFSCDEFHNLSADLKLGNCSISVSLELPKEKEKTSPINSSKEKTINLINSSVQEVQSTMSDNPDLWKILETDRLHFRYPAPRGPRCHRCRERGHMAIHCPSKRGPPACMLCGNRDHGEPRCPRAMCTSCGRLGTHTTYCSGCVNWRNVQCRICCLYGHIDVVCPDAWRRYHLTTRPGPIVVPAVEPMKEERDRWCSGCARPGHFESACTYYHRTHFAVYPEVINYVDLYNFPKSQPYIIFEEEPPEKIQRTIVVREDPQPSTSAAETTPTVGRKSAVEKTPTVKKTPMKGPIRKVEAPIRKVETPFVEKTPIKTPIKINEESVRSIKITITKSSERIVDFANVEGSSQDHSFHDAETSIAEKNEKREDNTPKTTQEEGRWENVKYLDLHFPSPEFMPLYFRRQMATLRKQHVQDVRGSPIIAAETNIEEEPSVTPVVPLKSQNENYPSATTSSAKEFIGFETSASIPQTSQSVNEATAIVTNELGKQSAHSVYSRQKAEGYNQKILLEPAKRDYINSKRGIDFLDHMKKTPGLVILLNKLDSTWSEISIKSMVESFVYRAKKEILKFLHNAAEVAKFPKESKRMLVFLEGAMHKLESTEGNCWVFYKKLTKFNHKPEFTTNKKQYKKQLLDQENLQMLLFGRLQLEDGAKHLTKLRDWIQVLQEIPSYILALDDIFEIYDSYSYIFEPRQLHNLKYMCSRNDYYILPNVNTGKPKRKLNSKKRDFIDMNSDFVIEACRKHNLPNRFMTELAVLRKTLQASDYARVLYPDFVKFLTKFKSYMTQNKIC